LNNRSNQGCLENFGPNIPEQGLKADLSGVKVDNPDHQVLSVSVETFLKD
jgi:hypothetical protein